MRIDNIFNRLSEMVFGFSHEMRPKLYLHSQNLNEDRNGEVKGLPWEGRLWMRWNDRQFLHFSWNLWTHFCGFSVQADPEDGGIKFHAAFPPISFWVSLPIFKKWSGYQNKNLIDISVHGWAIWWQFGGDTMSWDRKTPKWKHGNFHFDDFILGQMRHTEVVVERKAVAIPMPEGTYQGQAKLTNDVWKRPLWFAKRKTFIWIDIPKGIPHQGKGENSYDCGTDGLFGCGVEGESYEKAIAHVVEVVLRNRRKYDGNMNAVYPAPPTETAATAP